LDLPILIVGGADGCWLRDYLSLQTKVKNRLDSIYIVFHDSSELFFGFV
jgi:hypothetical protein